MKDINISFDRWLELLQKTVQGNNWKALHPKFNTDNSYYREMKNYLDCVLDSSYDLIEDKFHPSMYADLKKIRDSIDNNKNVWKAFRAEFSRLQGGWCCAPHGQKPHAVGFRIME